MIHNNNHSLSLRNKKLFTKIMIVTRDILCVSSLFNYLTGYQSAILNISGVIGAVSSKIS